LAHSTCTCNRGLVRPRSTWLFSTVTRGLATAHDLPQSITAPEASAYLSSVLSLPPSAAFPPALALQILTHKSYRFVHRIAHAPPYTSAELAQGQASHNGRLGFVGRRAIAAYSAIFLHSALGSAERAHEADFLRGKDIEGKLEALRHANNLGRVVGDKWGVGEVMRHDRQEVSAASGEWRTERAACGQWK
jgi:hypothetical protein